MGIFSSIGSMFGGGGGIAGGILDSIMGANGASSANKKYTNAIDMAMDLLDKGISGTETRIQPTAQVGTDTMGRLSDILLKGDMSKFYDNPAFQYAQDQSMRATNASNAAQGVLMSGNTLKELQKNASGLASQNYGSYIDNLSRLFSQADPYLQQYNEIPYTRAQNAANLMLGKGAAQRDAKLAKSTSLFGGGGFGNLGGIFSGLSGFGGGGSTMDNGWLFSNGSMGGTDLGMSMPWLG